MKRPKCSRRLGRGLYYELIEDVGPIPCGIYRLIDSCEESVAFEAGKKATFMIAGEWQDKIRPVSQNGVRLRRTTQGEFLERYYELLAVHKSRPLSIKASRVFTMCSIDPSVACQYEAVDPLIN